MSRHFEEPRRRNWDPFFRPHKRGHRGIAELIQYALRRGNRPKRGDEPDAGGVPVEPNNPRNLSGGAAAVPETEQ
jgi:hypothetical protein